MYGPSEYMITSTKIKNEFNIENPQELLRRYSGEELQLETLRYYREIPDVNSPFFEIIKDSTIIHETPSLFMSPFKTRDGLSGLNYIETDRCVQEYDIEFLSQVIDRDVHSKSFYNGEKLSPIYDPKNDQIEAIKTDYFTSRMFTEPLKLEMLDAYRIRQEDGSVDYGNVCPLRNGFLSSREDFLKPMRPPLAGSRGVIVMNTPNDGYNVLLGRRSTNVDVAQEMVSTFPAGTIEFLSDGFSPRETVCREFAEEFFQEGEQSEYILDQFNIERVSSGWGVRAGEMVFDYVLYSEDISVYEQFMRNMNPNEELAELVEFHVNDVSRLTELTTVQEMSGDAIHAVYFALKYLDEQNVINLDYSIQPDWA